ncbi:MAG TPA: hypothetical protein VK741_23625 [Acetobacteraceae bacterium]|jgi:hypothetical protein|nr:hypothetical protein [Acetobacteraceae bacterium]
MVRIEFKTRQYQFAHGKQPRGFGYWAFTYGGDEGEALFAPHAMSLTDAKKWVAAVAREQAAASGFSGTLVIEVGP